MTVFDFKTAVIDRSHEVPVVVDFWAAWCGPCRMLGPVIEQLAAEDAGRWELVKLDVEAHPDVARDYGIQGIPAVKLFRNGSVVGDFVGALPAGDIRRWLDDHLPDERLDRLESIVGRAAHPFDREIVTDLEAFVENHADVPLARLRLGQAIVADDPARARELATSGEAADNDLAADIASLADLMQLDHDLPGKLAQPLTDARRAFSGRNVSGALEHLIDAAMLDRQYADQLARRAAVALLRASDSEDEEIRRHQRRLAMVLHV